METPGVQMSVWMNFCDSLASTGGAILVLLLLMWSGVAVMHWHKELGYEVAHDSFVAILAVLGAKRLNNGVAK